MYNRFWMRIPLCILVGLAGASGLAAADVQPPPKLVLLGQVTGSDDLTPSLNVALFGVDSPFTATTYTDEFGAFQFGSLAPGTYTVSVMRQSLGDIRRTVVVTESLADRKGRVHITIEYSAAEVAASRSGATVSRSQLSIPRGAWNKYSDALKRLAKPDVEAARRSLEQAVEIAPQFSAAWNRLGALSYQTHDYSKAEVYFRKALEADPDAFEPIVNLGGVLLNLGRPIEALPFNRKAQANRPQDPLANAQLGMNYYDLGEFDRAEPGLAAAERIDPSHFSRPQLYLARIYVRRGDRAAALVELNDYVARHPDAPDVSRLRRWIQELEAPAP
jgi:Tfp pilus assembly protein PilF